jgi:hypothetical protein
MSEERKMVSIDLFNLTSLDEFEETLDEFIEWIKEEASKVPEEFRDSIRVRGENEYGECDHYTIVTARYERPETDDEMNNRIISEGQRRKYKLSRELCEYNRLKAIFG